MLNYLNKHLKYCIQWIKHNTAASMCNTIAYAICLFKWVIGFLFNVEKLFLLPNNSSMFAWILINVKRQNIIRRNTPSIFRTGVLLSRSKSTRSTDSPGDNSTRISFFRFKWWVVSKKLLFKLVFAPQVFSKQMQIGLVGKMLTRVHTFC